MKKADNNNTPQASITDGNDFLFKERIFELPGRIFVQIKHYLHIIITYQSVFILCILLNAF